MDYSPLAKRNSPLAIPSEHVVRLLGGGVAGEPTARVVPLRRLTCCVAWPERIGWRVVLKNRVSPSAAIGEPLAVLHHEIHIRQVAWHSRPGKKLVLLRHPVNLRHLRPVWDRLTVSGNAGPVCVDHYGIPEDDSDGASVVTDRDRLPVLVPSEFREC